jgi:CheY-like chemotaxis protein
MRLGRSERGIKLCGFLIAAYAIDLMKETRSILIVEDEPLIAMMLEDFLDSLGHNVRGTCDTVEAALEEVEKGGFDLAILDVNLKGENVWPVATKLREKNVPFVIATGGHVDPPPPEFDDAPVIEKPYTVDRVTPAIEAALAD